MVQQLLLAVMLALLVAPISSFIFQQNKPTGFAALQELIDQSQGGAKAEYSDEIKGMMVAISQKRRGDQRKQVPGQWELIYTTEKEVNFFKSSWPFDRVSDITQRIDLYDDGTVQNSINFLGGATFAVNGNVAPADADDSDYDRVQFQFSTAAIENVWGRTLTVPPVGAGWFDTMYCDASYRLSQDSRGDWSVFKRLGKLN